MASTSGISTGTVSRPTPRKRPFKRENFPRKNEGKNRTGNKEGQDLRPTHFLSLPIGHHPTLQASVQAFHDALLLPTNTLVDGIDRSILVHPRRLHLTLGVMHLEPENQGEEGGGDKKTVQSALALLRSLAPHVNAILNGSRLEVCLNQMDVMNVRKDEANVLFLGPDIASETGQRLKTLCHYVHEEFKKAGYITETRPLKLHCTIINASHRRPRPKKFTSFAYSQLMDSVAVRNVTIREGKPLVVEFGTHTVDEIQLCIMGSHGPQNEYVSCGGIALIAA